MLTRIISGAIGIGLAILIIGYGQIPFLVAVNLLAVIGLLEFYRLTSSRGIKPFRGFGILSGLILITLTYFYHNSLDLFQILIPTLLGILFLTFLLQLVKYGTVNAITNVAVTFLGIVYIAGLLAHFILLRNLENPLLPGKDAIWLALVCTWVTDSFAYFVGKSLGRHKLAPKISPKKTIEGFIGGLFGSLLTGIVFSVIVGVGLQKVLYIALVVGIVGQIADLFESSLKRDAEIKDSGNLIPGHGGVLDRFDSALFTLPFTYYLVMLLF